MLSPTLTVGFAAPATLLRPSYESTCLMIPPRHLCLSSCRSSSWNTEFLITAHATNMSAGRSDDPEKLARRKVWESLPLPLPLPQPVRSFPWAKAVASFFRHISELVLEVAKYLCVPVLAVSSLSEMSYCAHERKMALIPFPFLAGFAVAGILRETAVQLSPEYFKEGEFPWHLLSVAVFFTLLKLVGPSYPYWGRLIIPHFANGGLWRTIWFAFCWCTRLQGASEVKETPVAESQIFDPLSVLNR